MRNAWRHPALKRKTRCGVCDEHITNNITTLSAAEISAQYTDARLAQMIREGVDTLDLKLNVGLITEDDPAVGIDFTLIGGASTKIAAVGDILARYYALGGKAGVITYLHGGTSAFYSKVIKDLAASVATYITTVGGHLGAVYSDPRTIHAWAVEAPAFDATYEVATETTLGEFHGLLQSSLGATVWDARTWLVPRLGYSGPTNAAGMLWIAPSEGGGHGPQNIAAGNSHTFGPFTVPVGEASGIPFTCTAGAGDPIQAQFVFYNLSMVLQSSGNVSIDESMANSKSYGDYVDNISDGSYYIRVTASGSDLTAFTIIVDGVSLTEP
jgi:hypothetical protein